MIKESVGGIEISKNEKWEWNPPTPYLVVGDLRYLDNLLMPSDKTPKYVRQT